MGATRALAWAQVIKNEEQGIMDMKNINPETVNYLGYCQTRLNLQPQNMRLLDYGCGTGQAVLSLRLAGYEAFGVDIDRRAISDGQKLLDEHGFDGRNILFSFKENEPIPFDDKTFHFIMSHEVIEHIGDISIVTRDLRRVSAPDGLGFHVFRPPYNIVEPHFGMPFVHWLPKNKLRKCAIMMFAYLGMGMHPPEIPGAGPRERAEFLYHYSITRTFYRPYSLIGNAFRESGFGICFPATNHRKLRNSSLFSGLLAIPIFDRLLGWFILTFGNAYLLTQTPNSEDKLVEDQIQIGNWKSRLLT